MRIPTENEIFTSASGQKWIVESITTAAEIDDADPDFFLLTIVKGDDASDLAAESNELTNDEFLDFCEVEGIRF